jgi:hypothetical protein
MISAVSGSNASALLALLGRSQTDTSTYPSQIAASTPSQPPPPLPQGNGASAQSLFDALVHAGHGTKDQPDKGKVDEALSSFISSLDADGDGKLSSEELKSALSGLAGPASDESNQAQAAGAAPGTSLYESLFNAMAAGDGSPASASRKNDLVRKFLSLLEV